MPVFGGKGKVRPGKGVSFGEALTTSSADGVGNALVGLLRGAVAVVLVVTLVVTVECFCTGATVWLVAGCVFFVAFASARTVAAGGGVDDCSGAVAVMTGTDAGGKGVATSGVVPDGVVTDGGDCFFHCHAARVAPAIKSNSSNSMAIRFGQGEIV